MMIPNTGQKGNRLKPEERAKARRKAFHPLGLKSGGIHGLKPKVGKWAGSGVLAGGLGKLPLDAFEKLSRAWHGGRVSFFRPPPGGSTRHEFHEASITEDIGPAPCASAAAAVSAANEYMVLHYVIGLLGGTPYHLTLRDGELGSCPSPKLGNEDS